MIRIKHSQNFQTKRASGGFSLVEVALALTIVAIGMMGIFSLISVGLDSNIRSESEARAALFGEEALNTLRYYSTVQPLIDEEMTFELDPPAAVYWEGNKDLLWLTANPNGGGVITNVYRWDSSNKRSIESVEYAIRYKLNVGRLSPDIAWALLQVWGGEHGSTNDPRVYYTEMFNQE